MYMMGMGEKNRNIYKAKTKEKFPCLVAPVYEKMVADCFPVSENTENEPVGRTGALV